MIVLFLCYKLKGISQIMCSLLLLISSVKKEMAKTKKED